MPSDGSAKTGGTVSVKGKKYKLVEQDEYPLGVPGWWATSLENSDVLGLQECEHGVIARSCSKCKIDDRNNSQGWPMSQKCSFIEPGVVMYADVGMVLVRKDVLDKMANSFVGKPVINADHRDVTPEDFTKGNVQGIINSVWFDPKDAMYHAAYQVWDQPTLKNIKDGFRVSCAYRVTRWGASGIHNNVPYEREVLDGEYTHLAIVANPRYDGVKIYNDKGAKTMTLKWIKKLLGADGKEMENSVEIESSKSVVDVEGKEVPLDNLINAFKEAEAKKKAALDSKGPALTDMIDVDGRKVAVSDLLNAYKAKNAEEDEEKKKKEAKDKEDRENAAAAQLKNDLEKAHKDGKHDKDEKDNCSMCNDLRNARGAGHFQKVADLANSRKGDLVDELPEPYDGFAEGRSRFGSEKPAATK